MENFEEKEINLRYTKLDVLLEKQNTRMYRIRDAVTNDFCVMKIRMGRDLTGIYRQLEEIHHPNLPEIYEVFYDGCDTVIIEEYIAGEGLDLRIERQTLTEEETIHIILQLCDALTVIHTQKPVIIHRDIKASNVMIKADGIVKLIDFDAARNYHEEQERDTQQMGTLEYASPEHFGYAQTDEKSDIYSVGVLMHEMLTGETFSQEDVRYKGKLRHIIRKCTRVNADRRYRTARHLKRKLYSYYHYRKRRIAATVLALSVFVLVAGVTVRYYQQKRVRQVEDEEKKVIELSGREAFCERVAVFDKEKGNMANLLKDEYVADEIEKLLGNDTTYFVNNFDEIEGYYDADEKMYIVYGNRIQSSVSKRNEDCSIIAIRENGNIQCAYTSTERSYYPLICFKTNAEEEYHKVPDGMQRWLIDNYKDEYILSLTEEDFQKLWSDKIELEDDETISIEGDYVLQSSYGSMGKINISKKSQKEESYKIQGTITCKEKKREVDIIVKKRKPYYYYYEDEDVDIEIGTFFDSIFLYETGYTVVDGVAYDIEVPITGQLVKEKSH